MDKERFSADLAGFVGAEGEPGFVAEPWYNPHGDCLVYKCEEVAVVAERVDDVLTIYESADDGSAIGFKIKGVCHLLQEMGCDTMAVMAATDESGEIVEVSVAMILFEAFIQDRPTIARREGYARAAEKYAGRVSIPRAAFASV